MDPTPAKREKLAAALKRNMARRKAVDAAREPKAPKDDMSVKTATSKQKASS